MRTVENLDIIIACYERYMSDNSYQESYYPRQALQQDVCDVLYEYRNMLAMQESSSVTPLSVTEDEFKCPCCGMIVNLLNSYCWNYGKKLKWNNAFDADRR